MPDIDGNNSCFGYTALGFNGVCCSGAYFRDLSANILHPVAIIAGIILSLISYVTLDQSIEIATASPGDTVRRQLVHRKYYQPAYYILKAISLNAHLFFLTAIPMAIHRCTAISPGVGAYGYALSLLATTVSAMGNDAAHWCSYGLMIAYGVERCLTLNNRSKHFRLKQSMYSHFLAAQFAFLKGMATAGHYEVYKDEKHDEWHIGLAKEDLIHFSPKGRIIVGLCKDFASIAIVISSVLSYVYICRWLLSKTPLPTAPSQQSRQASLSTITSSTTISETTAVRKSYLLNKVERSLTRIYVVIATTFIVYAIYLVPSDLAVFHGGTDESDAVRTCNSYEIVYEIARILLLFAELAAASMGFAIHSTVNAKRLTQLLFKKPKPRKMASLNSINSVVTITSDSDMKVYNF